MKSLVSLHLIIYSSCKHSSLHYHVMRSEASFRREGAIQHIATVQDPHIGPRVKPAPATRARETGYHGCGSNFQELSVQCVRCMLMLAQMMGGISLKIYCAPHAQLLREYAQQLVLNGQVDLSEPCRATHLAFPVLTALPEEF